MSVCQIVATEWTQSAQSTGSFIQVRNRKLSSFSNLQAGARGIGVRCSWLIEASSHIKTKRSFPSHSDVELSSWHARQRVWVKNSYAYL